VRELRIPRSLVKHSRSLPKLVLWRLIAFEKAWLHYVVSTTKADGVSLRSIGRYAAERFSEEDYRAFLVAIAKWIKSGSKREPERFLSNWDRHAVALYHYGFDVLRESGGGGDACKPLRRYPKFPHWAGSAQRAVLAWLLFDPTRPETRHPPSVSAHLKRMPKLGMETKTPVLVPKGSFDPHESGHGLHLSRWSEFSRHKSVQKMSLTALR
jgi:hypothetical protein